MPSSGKWSPIALWCLIGLSPVQDHFESGYGVVHAQGHVVRFLRGQIPDLDLELK
jgi:hypothetical protein